MDDGCRFQNVDVKKIKPNDNGNDLRHCIKRNKK